MEFRYEIYTCNKGNPTAIIDRCDDEEMYGNIAEKIYEIHPEVDQVAIILDVKSNECVFQLVNMEFCGNACLSVSAYIYNNYKIKDTIIVNKVINEYNEVEYIKIKSNYDGKKGHLSIPKNLFLTDYKCNDFDNYIVKMNGITHLIIPKSYGEMNEKYAIPKIEEMKEKNLIPDVLGIIFLEDYKIDPFIWINRISYLQHQMSCLSGSIAALEYLKEKESKKECLIYQPTGEAYDIQYKNDYINITGIVRSDREFVKL